MALKAGWQQQQEIDTTFAFLARLLRFKEISILKTGFSKYIMVAAVFGDILQQKIIWNMTFSLQLPSFSSRLANFPFSAHNIFLAALTASRKVQKSSDSGHCANFTYIDSKKSCCTSPFPFHQVTKTHIQSFTSGGSYLFCGLTDVDRRGGVLHFSPEGHFSPPKAQ